ncbi:DUF2589 domain-containing protein [Enterovibrio coralii]|uniref:DUF2589 domain-containing protein n=1 Tax=Enterovibrio coralii TaxID=294935 RepID=A0A135IA28_9GAMM|nr:DUF2589 domain-containing protein [Enterovibrio coralii]KXF82316.1 hypothetical protein ATN88_09125 [Enterovibrio coralii]
MIKFQALMQAIQKSIHSAAQAVESEGIKHVDKFFDKVPSEKYHEQQNQRKRLTEAHEALDRKDMEKANSLLKEFNDVNENAQNVAPEQEMIHRPKMVAMAFPKQGKNGEIEKTIVNVPLITLCPISSPRIKEVHFEAELEVTADDNDELHVAFRPLYGNQSEGQVRADDTNTKIAITLVGHEPPKGLQKVVEGYEKVLRAQIPG